MRAGLEAVSVQELARWWTISGTWGPPDGIRGRQDIVDAIVREIGQPLSLLALWRESDARSGLRRSDVPELPSEPGDVRSRGAARGPYASVDRDPLFGPVGGVLRGRLVSDASPSW